MPLFEYRCDNSHKIEELYIRFSDSPKTLPSCPVCSKPMSRIISLPRVKVRGQEAPVDTFEEAWDGLNVDHERVERANHKLKKRKNKHSFENERMFFDQSKAK